MVSPLVKKPFRLGMIVFITVLISPMSTRQAFAQAADGSIPGPETVGVTAPRDGYPDLSPDGSRIVFQSNRSGNWQLWLVNTDGTGLHRLTHSEGNDFTPVWSPDGTRILFASDRAGGKPRLFDPNEPTPARDIYVLELADDGVTVEKVTRIVEHPSDDMHPKWAAGGMKVVFNRVYATEDGADVIIADADGANETVLDTKAGWNTYAAITSDGSAIVWRGMYRETGNEDSAWNSDIFVADADGKNRRRLTHGPAFDGWPAPSPDGSRIAFASNRGGDGRFHIYTMAPDGSELRQLTFDDFNHTQPGWSADGRRLTAFRWVEDAAGEIGHIVLLDADGKE